MKYVKMLGLTAIAATALMAFIGAGTASATVLCKNNLNTEKCSERYPAGTKLEAKLIGTAKLDTSFKTVTCNKVSPGTGTMETEGSATTTPFGKNGTGTYEECNCEIKVLKEGSLEIHQIAGTDNGTLTESGGEVTMTCSSIFGNVHCIYGSGANVDGGELKGGNPAKEVVSLNIPRLPTNSICSEEAVLTGEYEITSPKPLYVAAG
jgi:hypothetical protein